MITTTSAIGAALVLLVMCTTPHASAGKPLDRKFLRGFMSGEYELIGRKPDSTATYTGHVTLREESDSLRVTRFIDGKTTKATMRFETIGGTDQIPVARMHFTLDGVEYEVTYMWELGCGQLSPFCRLHLSTRQSNQVTRTRSLVSNSQVKLNQGAWYTRRCHTLAYFLPVRPRVKRRCT